MHSKEDVLDRESFIDQIVDLTRVLSENRKNCCFAIEGEWGSGKSFVLDKIQERLQVEQSEITNTERFFVVRYDCWKYDYYEEPIIAIVSVLREKIEQYVKMLSDSSKKAVLVTARNAITKIAVEAVKSKTGIDLNGILETPEEIEKIYDKYFDFQNSIKEMQNQIKKISEDQTIVIMVDELDRCLPSYAIKVLERVHHVFNEMENVAVMITMEKTQIKNSLHQIYGEEMDVDRYLKKIVAFSFKLDNGIAHNFIAKYASFMELFEIKESDKVEEFLKEITAEIDIRTQEKIFEKAENLHRLVASQERNGSEVLAFEILTLCVKEKTGTANLDWVINMIGYPNVKRKAGKKYYDAIKKYVKDIMDYPTKINNKFVCKENNFIDKMIFIIAGLNYEYKNGICEEFYCEDKTIEKELNFSRKIYELLKM